MESEIWSRGSRSAADTIFTIIQYEILLLRDSTLTVYVYTEV